MHRTSVKANHLVITGFFLLCSCAEDPHYRDGLASMKAGNVRDGVAKLKQAAQTHPDNGKYLASYLGARDRAAQEMADQAVNAIILGDLEKASATTDKLGLEYPEYSRTIDIRRRISEVSKFDENVKLIRNLLNAGDTAQAWGRLQLAQSQNPNDPRIIELRQFLEKDQFHKDLGPTLKGISSNPITLEFRDANLKLVLEALSRGTGLNFILDKDVRPDLQTTLFVRQVALEEAIDIILTSNRLRKKILNAKTILIYPDSPEKIAAYQDLALKSFYLTNINAKQASEMLKALLKIKSVYIDEKLNIVTIRDTPQAISLAKKLLDNQDLSDAEVMLELAVVEVSRDRMLDLGIESPSKLTFTPLSTSGSGGLLLSDLKNLSSRSIAVGGANTTLHLQDSSGDVNLLAAPRIRAKNHEKANVLIGQRIPIITSTSSATGLVAENVQYQDVGLKLEAEPNIYLNSEVGIKLSMEVSSLGTQVSTSNGSTAYQINTRTASTILRLRDGETQVLAGLLNNEERNSANRLPGLGNLPLLGHLFSEESRRNQKTEIMLAVTPRIIRALNTPAANETIIWSGTENELRSDIFEITGAGSVGIASVGGKINAIDSGGDSKSGQLSSIMPTLIMSATKSSAKVGESVAVTISIDSALAILGVPIQLSFDPAKLKVEAISEGDFFKQSTAPTLFSSTVNSNGGEISVSTATNSTSGIKGKGDLVTITLIGKLAGRATFSVLGANMTGENGPRLEVPKPPPLIFKIE